MNSNVALPLIEQCRFERKSEYSKNSNLKKYYTERLKNTSFENSKNSTEDFDHQQFT